VEGGLSYLEQDGSNVILSAKNDFKDSGCKHTNYGAYFVEKTTSF
jgi:hypothetical protein